MHNSGNTSFYLMGRRLTASPFLSGLMALFILLPLFSSNAMTEQGINSEIRVSLLSKYSPAGITVSAPEGVCFIDGKTFQPEEGKVDISCCGPLLQLSTGKKPPLTGEKARFTVPGTFSILFSVGDAKLERRYRGSLEVSPEMGRLLIIGIFEPEDYVHWAAYAEISSLLQEKDNEKHVPGWRKELLSAMEVAVRSYISSQQNRHPGKSYRFCDLTHCVHFPGIQPCGDPELMNALTPGEVMTGPDGKVVNAYFHSTCGGILSGPEVLWDKTRSPRTFRRGADTILHQSTPLCSGSPHFRWKCTIRQEEMELILGASHIREIKANCRQGRVTSLAFTTAGGKNGTTGIAAFLSRAGRLLGWNRIKSNFFSIERDGTAWILDGRGLGHGVGLCQWGARALAIQGYGYREILMFYYNNPHFIIPAK